MDFFLLTLLGGLLALDGTSVGQFMVSRPLVAGVLTGWVVGDPTTGLLVGGLLEIFFIPAFPVGGVDFPEGGPPTVVAVATACLMTGPGGWALGALLGFLWARLGTYSIRVLRNANAGLVPDPGKDPTSGREMEKAHVLAIGFDFLRGALLTSAGLLLGIWLNETLAGAWPLSGPATLGLLALGAAFPAGALVVGLGGWRKRGVLFGVGLLGFLALSLIL